METTMETMMETTMEQQTRVRITAGQRTTRRGGRALGLATALGLALGGAALGGGVAPTPAHADTCTSATEYDYAGTATCFVVPAGVTGVTFDVYGAQGGAGGSINSYAGGAGGLGGEARATFAVTPGQRFYINPGGKGGDGSTSTDAAAGAGGSSVDEQGGHGDVNGELVSTLVGSGGGGGAASDVRPVSADGSYPGLSSRLVVAGGGGGGGGAAIGTDTPGAGGASGGAGSGDSNPSGYYHADPGQGGTATQGGTGVDGNTNGSLGQGGGTHTDHSGGGGGGGGGGYYGGGGGGSNVVGSSGAGGGGGSSYAASSASAASLRSGVQAGNGKVLISYVGAVALSSSANPNSYYQQPTFTATVSPTPAGGLMKFTEDGYPMIGCLNQPVVNGVATCTLAGYNTYMTVGTHQIVATFSGSGNVQGGASSAVSQIVQAQTETDLAVTTLNGQTGAAAVTGQPVQLTATVYAFGAPGQTPAGAVTFYADGRALGSAWPRGAGGKAQATLTTTSLGAGTHAITASYGGDSTTQSSASTTVSQAVQAGSFFNDAAPGTGISYNGAGWGYYAHRGVGDYQDDVHATAHVNDEIIATFTGTGIAYIAEKSADEGNVEVYVDGVDKGTVSCWASAYNVSQQVIYRVGGLPAGPHTLVVRNLTQNSWMLLDALAVTQ